MTIIIEGPDNSGKSTLGKKLAADLGYPYNHSIRPKSTDSELQIYKHHTAQITPNLRVQDRCFAISDLVYGRVVRRTKSFSNLHQKMLLDIYYSRSLFIYCRPSDEAIMECNGREQMRGVVDNFPRVIKEYDDIFTEVIRFAKCNVIKYDWEKDRYSILLDRCKEALSQISEAQTSSIFFTKFRR